MTSATQDPPSVPGEENRTVEVHPIDPLRDVDGKTTAMWMIFGGIGIALTLYALLYVFMFAVETTRYEKIDLAPTTELDELRAREDSALGKAVPAKPTDRRYGDLRTSIQKYTTK